MVWGRPRRHGQTGRRAAAEVTGPIVATTGAARGAEQVEGARHRRRRGEGHGVGASGRGHGLGPGIAGHRAVGHDFVDRPPLARARRRAHPTPSRPGEQDGTDPAPGRPARRSGTPRPTHSATEASGTRSTGRPASSQRPGRGRPRPRPTGPRRRPPGHRSRREAGDGVGRGECHPLVGPGGHSRSGGEGQSVAPVGGILDGDDRELDHRGPESLQPVASSEAWDRARVPPTVRPARGGAVIPSRRRRARERGPVRPPGRPR